MTSAPPQRVVLLWHMHQPEYRVAGIPRLPWVHLHGLRGYADMAAHMEAVPEARAVVNFSPVLLDQIVAAAEDARGYFHAGRRPATPLLAGLLDAPTGTGRGALMAACQPALAGPGSTRFAAYAELAGTAATALALGAEAVAAYPDAQLLDLVSWYHLVWLGEGLRRDPRAASLLAQAGGYSARQRQGLLALIADTLDDLLPRYRRLARDGRVELSMSPYYHPLQPLLLDFASAHENAAVTPLPGTAYPDGRERARWHLEAGRECFEALFGSRPRGCWPSEAAVSDAAARQIAALGFDWIASSESVLRASLHHHGLSPTGQPSQFRLADSRLQCFFRDDELSDRIGFVYKDWQPADAVADLVERLERRFADSDRTLIVIALDGENPWEHYPDQGIAFVRGLYRTLAAHPRLQLATFADCIGAAPATAELPFLVAGSWVHGQLLTWVGHPEKNLAWELLMDAKRCFDASPDPSPAARRALAACEGSDWFWWPGTHHIASAIADFDRLFRAHLRELYSLLGETPPAVLDQPFASALASQGAALGAMLPSQGPA
ncbi:MAG: glycoside hydrolase family 57 protein [Stagnimonas sp.]|nr:glycoside hydrolase family 57 protein [Stagnimonas sp.]